MTGQVLQYTQAIHWFVSVVVLSKQMHGQASSFPAKQLMDQYREKRHKTDSLQTSYGQPGLLIDILCRDIGEDLVNAFKRGGRPATYPDPSLQPLADCSAPAKHRLVQYFFLDLSHQLPHDTWPDLFDSIIKFPSLPHHQTQSGLLAAGPRGLGGGCDDDAGSSHTGGRTHRLPPPSHPRSSSYSEATLPRSPIHSPPSPARNGSQVKVHFVSLVPLAIKIPFKFAFEGKVCNIYEAGVVFGSIGIPGSLVGILRSCVGIGWKLHFILLDSPFQAHIFSFFNPLLGAQHKCQH